MESEKPVRNPLTETALFRPHKSRSRDKCCEISKCPDSCELDPPFSHQNRSSQINMTCLIAKRLACLSGVVMVYLYPSCCRPSPGDQETEAGLKPGFRQVQSTYISCNWSHLNLQAWSSPEPVVGEKEIRSAKKGRKNWSNAYQVGFEFARNSIYLCCRS